MGSVDYGVRSVDLVCSGTGSLDYDMNYVLVPGWAMLLGRGFCVFRGLRSGFREFWRGFRRGFQHGSCWSPVASPGKSLRQTTGEFLGGS